MIRGSERRRIVITGASGFVGRWLLRELLHVDGTLQDVVATHRGDGVFHEFFGTELNEQILDIEDESQIDAFVRDVRPTAIVHLAAIAAPGEAKADPTKAWRVNVTGSLKLASSVLRYAPGGAFLFVGSSEAYGESFNAESERINERAALEPITPYGVTKAAADIAIGQMARDGLRALRFRPFNHSGPGQSASYVVPAFAEQIARIEAGLQPPEMRVGRLDAQRDFLDVRDVVRAYGMALAIDPERMKGQRLNLASGKARTIQSILSRLTSAISQPIEILHDAQRVRSNEVSLVVGDPSAAKAFLGWSPTIDFDVTIVEVLADIRRKLLMSSGAA